MPQNRDHSGELLPNGFRVGDYVTYTRNSDGHVERSGYVTYNTELDAVWATFDDSEAESRARFERGERGSYLRPISRVTLIRRHDGALPSTTTTEGSNTMSVTWNGEELSPEAQPAEVIEGQEYRVIYPTDYHRFEFIGRATRTTERGRSVTFEITQWVVENPTSGYGNDSYPIGYRFSSTADRMNSTQPTCLHFPYAPVVEAEGVQEEAYDGQKGAFLPHNGEMPEPGTIVRGMVHTTNKQVEGLFLRIGDSSTTATVECKRRRTKRANGTFGDWETYSNTTRRQVTVDGATVFKPGASTPAEPTWVRGTPITSAVESRAVNVGDIISGRERHGDRSRVYRGVVDRQYSEHGEWYITATETAVLANATSTAGVYQWEKITPREVHLLAQWADGANNMDRAGYVWTQSGPGVKRIDPTFDPNRKTPHTGQKIGDMVVGLMRERDGSRDTVSSWVKGEIVKWNTRYGWPIVTIVDKMESTKKVGEEVELVPEDTYPAMADPSAVSPEEYKRTLRLYLIGRHKRGDFCRGGLNTMLAAHGIPLYETRRRATMVVTLDYDPNVTDLYSVQQDLRRKMEGVEGFSFTEREGEDIELTLESDRTGD